MFENHVVKKCSSPTAHLALFYRENMAQIGQLTCLGSHREFRLEPSLEEPKDESRMLMPSSRCKELYSSKV